jgi:hypothetical protein
MTPQEKYVLDYIERHGSITANEAHDDLGINRLASRINDLKNSGYPIIKEWEYGRNRRGDKCHWARYRMGARG